MRLHLLLPTRPEVAFHLLCAMRRSRFGGRPRRDQYAIFANGSVATVVPGALLPVPVTAGLPAAVRATMGPYRSNTEGQV